MIAMPNAGAFRRMHAREVNFGTTLMSPRPKGISPAKTIVLVLCHKIRVRPDSSATTL